MRHLLFLFFLPAVCLSQASLDAEQFFSLGLSEFQQVEKPLGEEVNFPWINRYEFRTETRDFDLEEQEYTFRVSPSSKKIRNAQKAYSEAMKNAPDFEGQEIYCELLFSLHIDWLTLFILNENRSILEEWVLILADKQTIYERMAGTYEFDPQKLLKLQTEKSDIEIALNQIKLEQEFVLNKHSIQNQEIDFGDFATIESLSKYLNQTILPSKSEHRSVDLETEHKKQLIIKEMELESAEEKKIIDFVQLKYNGPHSDFLKERLSVGLGFQLYNSGDRKLKMQQLQIEREELNRKSERRMQEVQASLNSDESKLQNDIQSFFHFQKIMKNEKEQLQNLSTTIFQKEGTSPLFLLDVKERHLSMKAKSLDKKEELIRDYLKYLYRADKMCGADFVNFLIVKN